MLPKMPRERTDFRLPVAVNRALTMRAAKRRTTRTAVLVAALRVHLASELAQIEGGPDQLKIGEEADKKTA